MTIGDIYSKRPLYLTNKNFYGDFALLNKCYAVSDDKIRGHHLSFIKALPMDPTINKEIERLNADLYEPAPSGENIIQQALEFVEQSLPTKNTLTAFHKKYTPEQLNNLILEYKAFLAQAMQLYLFTKQQASFLNSAVVRKQTDQIVSLIKDLEDNIQVFSGGKGKVISKKGILNSAKAIRNALNGFLLEEKGVSFYASIIPTNLKVVNMGALYIDMDLFGNKSQGHQSRTDIGVFDKELAKTIEITYQIAPIGEPKEKTTIRTTLDKFLEAMDTAGEKNLSIYLYGEENIEKMRQALIRGVQAKSGVNQPIFNNTHVTINQAIQAEGSMYSKWLSLLTQLVHNNDTDDENTHNYYNSLFNYCLAKLQTTLIGRDNNIILTRTGFSTVKNYMTKLIQEKGIYAHAISNINIHTPNAKNIVFIRQKFDN